MFRKFDTDNSGAITLQELKGMLGQLGVSASDDLIAALMKTLDMSGNGVLEFEEFQNFLIVDPYQQKLWENGNFWLKKTLKWIDKLKLVG